MVPRKKVELVQGETFQLPLYWYRGDDVVKSITAASNDYPALCTAAGHGLPLTSNVPVTLIGPTSWLTTPSASKRDRIYAKAVNADTFTVAIDSTDEDAYAPGNTLIYTPPVDLAGWTARMQLRESVDADDIILEFTTENGRIALSSDGQIMLTADEADTVLLDFTTAIGDVEVISPGGVVTRVARLIVKLNKEGTR